MTTQTAVLAAPTGLTLTAKLFTLAAPDTVAFTADSVTERTNAKGQYVATFDETSVISGDHTLILFSGTRPVAIGYRTFAGVDAEVATATPGVAELDAAGLSAINAQVVDALSIDTYAELTSPPAATSSLKDKITWLFMMLRNKVTQTSSERKLFADDGSTVVGTESVSDDGTTYTKGESS